ncbi:hypothetical protein BD769DRAFT_1669615 [Suillus cothurnatus]|nr:hypothetical protein BD769DRAFT_1669615 [Suillus cothurnatus]
MAWTFAGLLRVFGCEGAFIIVERPPRGQPVFHIIPCICLQGMETQEDTPHLQSVLIVSKELYGTPAMADSIVHLIAHSVVATIYTESVHLAETIIRDAGEILRVGVSLECQSVTIGK